MRKKLVTITCVLFLLLLGIALNAFAVTLSIPNINVNKGATIQIPVNVDEVDSTVVALVKSGNVCSNTCRFCTTATEALDCATDTSTGTCGSQTLWYNVTEDPNTFELLPICPGSPSVDTTNKLCQQGMVCGGLAGFQFTLAFNKDSNNNNLLTPVLACSQTLSQPAALTQAWSISRSVLSQNEAILGGFDPNLYPGLTQGSGSLVNLGCRVVGNAGTTTTLCLTSTILSDINAVGIPHNLANNGCAVLTVNQCDPATYVPTQTTCGVGVCESTGMTSCVNGQIVDSCVAGTPTGSDNNCNGIDENCNGTADENYVPTPTTCGVGTCASTGQMICVNGQLQDTCQPGDPTASDANCDGKDNNCNGQIDEGYVPTPTVCGTGVCASTGMLNCVNGSTADTCVPKDGVQGPTSCGTGACASTGQLICQNGNSTDTCVCKDGVQGPTNCGTGVCASTGQLICQSCNPTNTCVPGQPTGSDNNCNGIDENCNSTADENYAPTPTTCGQGACVSTGQLICVNAEFKDTCQIGTPTAEICDGIDNNCDGQIDNGIAAIPATCGVGACASTGQKTCVNGQLQDSCVPGMPTGSDNNCNGIDENCNGTADENYVPTPTTCGVGTCASTGQMICVNGQLKDTCQPGDPAASDANCDGKDNNCNGQIDEGYVPTPTACGQGACASTGMLNCVNGSTADTCVPKDGVQGTTSCGMGVCASTGQLICQNGSPVDTCKPGAPQTEACGPTCSDGIDNDCDGATDSADSDCGAICGGRVVSIPDDLNGCKGEVALIPVNVEDAAGIAGFQCTVSYDPSVLDCTGAMTGDLTPGWIIQSNATPGQISVAGLEPTNAELPGGSGSLTKLSCTITGDVGTSTAITPACKLVNSTGVDIPSTSVPGKLDVPCSGPISAVVDIDPLTLNVKSQGQFITAYLELPAPYNVKDINVASIVLKDGNAVVATALSKPVGMADPDSLMVKFDRAAVIDYLTLAGKTSGSIEFTITGTLSTGEIFMGHSTVKVISPGK